MTPRFERFVSTGTGMRLDRMVADATGRGRRAVRELIRRGAVRIDGRVAGGAESPQPGSEITIEIHGGAGDAPPVAEPTVLAESAEWLLLAKPAGLHSERGRSSGSAAEWLERRDASAAQVGERPEEGGLVHRLDRDTSGVLLAARTPQAYRRLRDAFAAGRTRKQYLGLVAGRLTAARRIDVPLARRAERMTAASARDEAVAAVTRVEPLEHGDGWSLVLASMRTGAMHQVRVHLATIGLPLLGDALYGGPLVAGSARAGQLLHASRLAIDGELDASAGAPEDFLGVLARLRRGGLSACVSRERT